MKKLFFIFAVFLLPLSGCSVLKTVLSEPSTPHYTIAAEPLECVRQGNSVIFTFMVKNNGENLRGFKIQHGNESIITDNVGNTYDNCSVTMRNDGVETYPLPTGASVKVTVRINGVASSAASFSIIKLWAINSIGSAESLRGYFTFRNVAITQ